MPFTPFHLGPALFLGIPLRKYIHAPTFILANVILDVEPLLVLTLGLNYPLHGYLHTFIAAISIGVIFSLAMFFLERIMHPLYKTLLFETDAILKKRSFLIAGVMGTMLHVLFDSPLYPDIKPFYPLAANPLYGSASSLEISLLSVWMGILGITFYLLLVLSKTYTRVRERRNIKASIARYSRVPRNARQTCLPRSLSAANRSRSIKAEKTTVKRGRMAQSQTECSKKQWRLFT